MDSNKKRITTSNQFSLLLREMEKNPNMARGVPVFGSNRVSTDNEWDRIRGILNANGPPVRSTVAWKKVWTDMKSRCKKKLAENAAELRRTGGGPFCATHLTPHEQETVKILNLESNVLPSGIQFGLPYESTAVPDGDRDVSPDHGADGASSTGAAAASSGITPTALFSETAATSSGGCPRAFLSGTEAASSGGSAKTFFSGTDAASTGGIPASASRKRKASSDVIGLLQQQLDLQTMLATVVEDGIREHNGLLARIAISLEELVKPQKRKDAADALI